MNEIKIDMFTHSDWFGNDIYVSLKGNVYCMYHFDDIKYLIMDMDMSLEELKNIEDFDRVTSEVLVYWMYGDDYLEDRFKQSVRTIVAEYEENPKEFFKKYNTKGRNQIGVDSMENKKELRTVSPAEFITAWNEMEQRWINEDNEDYTQKIYNQEINIELPLLGIKTKLWWCPHMVECFDDMFKSMIDDDYFKLLVEKEQCYSTGGGFWIAEVPFEYGDKSLVMVVDNEHSDEWAVYQNVIKDNGKFESVEYDELLVESCHSKNILPDWQIYYIRALQLLADR